MKKGLIILIVVIAVAVLYGWSVYNRLVTTGESINNQWAQVESQYQRRFDLIPNLVELVKGNMKQEQQVFGAIAEARTKYGSAKTVDEKVGAANGVESALSRLLVVMENYPQLESSKAVQNVQVQLEGTENRISVERGRFNDSVKDYNLMVKRFPAKIVASMFGFSEKAYFQAEQGAEKAPQIKF